MYLRKRFFRIVVGNDQRSDAFARTAIGRDADDRYAPLGPPKAIGAQPVFLADVDTQFLDDTTSPRRCARGADVPAADARVAQAQLRP